MTISPAPQKLASAFPRVERLQTTSGLPPASLSMSILWTVSTPLTNFHGLCLFGKLISAIYMVTWLKFYWPRSEHQRTWKNVLDPMINLPFRDVYIFHPFMVSSWGWFMIGFTTLDSNMTAMWLLLGHPRPPCSLLSVGQWCILPSHGNHGTFETHCDTAIYHHISKNKIIHNAFESLYVTLEFDIFF